MIKVLLGLVMTVGILTANSNIGFLTNQKYICVSQGMLVGEKINPTSEEEAMKYPMRFYVDDNNVMHTDSKLILPHLDKTAYSDGNNIMNLIVDEDKRYLVTTNAKLKSFGASMIYVCVETNNWTIAR